jgi:hypothetical protein
MLLIIAILIVATIGETNPSAVVIQEIPVDGVSVRIVKDASGKVSWETDVDLNEEQAVAIGNKINSAQANNKAAMRNNNAFNNITNKNSDGTIDLKSDASQDDIDKYRALIKGNEVNSIDVAKKKVENRTKMMCDFLNDKLRGREAELTDLGLPKSVKNEFDIEQISEQYSFLVDSAKQYAGSVDAEAVAKTQRKTEQQVAFDAICARRGVDGNSVRTWFKSKGYPMDPELIGAYSSKFSSGSKMGFEMSQELQGVDTIARRAGVGTGVARKTKKDYQNEIAELSANATKENIDKAKKLQVERDRLFPIAK